MSQDHPIDGKILSQFLATTMPFGRYAGRLLIDLPEEYLVWFEKKGFPPGELGGLLALCLEIKANGLEGLLRQGGRRF